MSRSYENREINPILEKLVGQWLALFSASAQWKEQVFQKTARDMRAFYLGPKNWDELMGVRSSAVGVGDFFFKGSVNKAFEFVSTFAPNLYQENPVRTVKPRAPVQIPGTFFPDQQQFIELAQEEQARVAIDGATAILLEAYLNWTPSRYNLVDEIRLGVEEGLITGLGLAWTEVVRSPDDKFCSVITRFGSSDDLLIDPDAKDLRSAKWVARRNVQPVWKVERDYGIRPGTLKGNYESMTIQAGYKEDPDSIYKRAQGKTADLMVFWQVWTRMGIGGRMINANQESKKMLDEFFGDNCYLVLAEGCRFPLNLPPELVNEPGMVEETKMAAEWPIPFWVADRWPFEDLAFHRVANTPWPTSHLAKGKAELKLLNFTFSFMAGHLRNSLRDFLAIRGDLEEENKTALIEGRDLSVIELADVNSRIEDYVAFLQHPPLNADAWTWIDLLEKNFEKRVGLTDLSYGTTPDTQSRSATESNIRSQSAGIRPDDMATVVENWCTRIAEKEAFASRYLLSGDDVSTAMGPLGAMAWSMWVFTADPSTAFHALQYRIEAGSTRRPNKEFQVRQMQDAITNLMPVLITYAQTYGDYTAVNNLIANYAKANDMDPNPLFLRNVMAPPQMLSSSAPGDPTSQGSLSVYPASGDPQLG